MPENIETTICEEPFGQGLDTGGRGVGTMDYSYHGNSNTLSQKVYRWRYANDAKYTEETMTYDEEGNLIKKVINDPYGENEVFLYGEEERIISRNGIPTDYTEDDEEEYVPKVVIDKDEQGRLLSVFVDDEMRVMLQYNPEGFMSVMKRSGSTRVFYEYKYDEYGNWIQRRSMAKNDDGNPALEFQLITDRKIVHWKK